MGINQFDSIKDVEVVDKSGTPIIERPLPVYLTDGNDQATGTGKVIIDWNNVSTKQDLNFYDENNSILSYQFEWFDPSSNEALVWIDRKWSRDGTVQLRVAYGSGDQDREASGSIYKSDAQLVYHNTATAVDSSQNSNDGTVDGVTDDSDGQFARTGLFDGVDDAVTVSDDSSLDITDQITIITWFQIPGGWSSSKESFAEKMPTNEAYLAFLGSSGEVKWGISSGGNRSFLNYATNFDDTYHQIAFQYDQSSGDGEIFVDGSSTFSGSIHSSSSPIDTTNEGLRIGDLSDASGRWFDGRIDEFRIYDSLLSSEFIQGEYDASIRANQVFFSQQSAFAVSGNRVATSAGVIRTL